jgi:glycosyltransferase involved in cell wall biosynthesis
LTRVLFLTESFHPVLGGGEGHIRALGRALIAAGDSATVITRRWDPEWPAEDERDGIRVLRLGPTGYGALGKYRMVPGVVSTVRRLRAEFDVLVVRGTRVLGVPGLAAARSIGLPAVLQPEINGELSGEVYTWGKDWGPARCELVFAATRVRNQWLKKADVFVAMSHAIEAEMRTAGIADDKILRIPHGVDLERFRPASAANKRALRQKLGLPESARLVTYTGRLLEGKGLEMLLDVFTGVARTHPDSQVMLVGAGDGQTLSIEDDLRSHSMIGPLVGRVIFPGRVDNVEDYLRASDVFVFPSVFEALGISLVEAAACGLPCIGSRTGGIVDVIEHEQTGLLFEPGEADGLAAALERVLSDAALAARLGRGARERAERDFEWTSSVQSYRALFAGLAETTAAKRQPPPALAGAGFKPPEPAGDVPLDKPSNGGAA